jgi:hypothetical protein
LDDVEVLNSSDGYELWFQKMSVIFEVMSLYVIMVSAIDPSPLASGEVLIYFQVAQRQGLLVIIQVVSNEIFGEIAKFKPPHDMWIYRRTLYRCDSTLSYVFALRSCMSIEKRISPAKVSPSEFISAFKPEWNRIAHRSQSSTAGSPTYCKIVKDLFTYQQAKKYFLLAWFANLTIMLWKTYRQKTISPTTKQRSVSLTSSPTIVLPPGFPPRTPNLNTRLTPSLR